MREARQWMVETTSVARNLQSHDTLQFDPYFQNQEHRFGRLHRDQSDGGRRGTDRNANLRSRYLICGERIKPGLFKPPTDIQRLHSRAPSADLHFVPRCASLRAIEKRHFIVRLPLEE